MATKSLLEKEIVSIKKIKKERQHMFEETEKEIKNEQLKEEQRIKEIEKNLFNEDSEVFEYVEKISKKNELTIDLIGREFLIVDDKDIFPKRGFYYQAHGKENDLFNFIEEIENERRLISLKQNSIVIAINGNYLDLKTEIMYTSNNKKQDNEIFEEADKQKEQDIFQKKIPRNIGRKRRKI